jgi:predicted transcriptional regulator/transcriptional regulator with XRE-family HTH domain
MSHDLTGMKIRTLRRGAGMSQGELARRARISPSYLNLIEASKRPVSGVLLDRLAAGLAVERAVLDGEAERRLVDMLEEIAVDPAVAGALPHPGPAADLVGRNPGWGELVLRLYRAYHDQTQAVLALADRLNRDPFLGDSIHSMLTSVTSIRSAIEILDTGDDMDETDRQRFRAIVAADSRKLSTTANALVAFFDSANMRVRSATPTEHVDAFIFETDNYFPALETIAARFLAGLAPGETVEAGALRLLGGPAAETGGGDGALPDRAERRRFRLLKAVAAAIAGDAVEEICAGHAALDSDEARALAAAALQSYAAAAMLMPYDAFLEAAERHRYDLDMLSRLFGVSYEQAAHRLATLRRPGAEGVRFAFMRSDTSGYVTKRLPLQRLPMPRYSNACPLWVIHGAFQTPGVIVRAFGELPSGEQFLFFARAIEKQPARPSFPRHLLSVMLACSAADAHRVVHGDGVDRAGATIPVGTVCRLCPRAGCGHRQEPPLIA